MKKLGFRLLRRKPVLASAPATLAASARAPDSGFAFVTNLQGASAALSEFSDAVSAALAHIELEDDLEEGPFKTQLKRLEGAIGSYVNSNSDSCSGLTEWISDKFTAELVNMAFQCAATVYDSEPHSLLVPDSDGSHAPPAHRAPMTKGLKFTELEYAKPSFDGIAKAMGAWKVESEKNTAMEDHQLPIMVIAVRGTASFIDHIVNVNGRPISVNEFLQTKDYHFLRTFGDISAHSGFMGAAAALLPRVTSLVSKAREANIEHIVLTGHSAGGAVANLMYLHLLLATAHTEPYLKFSCITFGSPPTLNADITNALQSAPEIQRNRGVNLAFVNEFDMVPRADQTYIRSLIDIYRSIYDLAPLMDCAIEKKNSGTEQNPYVLPPLVFDEKKMNLHETAGMTGRHWKLPKAEYNIIGKLILLRKMRVPDSKSRVLLAQCITQSGFQELLYCGTSTHSRTFYCDRVNSILQGKFNGQESW